MAILAVALLLPLSFAGMLAIAGDADAAGTGTENDPIHDNYNASAYIAPRTLYIFNGTTIRIDEFPDDESAYFIEEITEGFGITATNCGGGYGYISGTFTRTGIFLVSVNDPDMNTVYITFNVVEPSYRVTFDSNGGSPCNPMTVTQGGSITLPTTTKANSTFVGWWTAPTGGYKRGDAGASYTPTSDVTLYARWTANTLTITGGAGDVTIVEGNYWSRAVTTSPAADGITVSGPSWLSKNGMELRGTPVAGTYNVTVTAHKANYPDAAKSFVITVEPKLVFSSVPTADMIIYEV